MPSTMKLSPVQAKGFTLYTEYAKLLRRSPAAEEGVIEALLTGDHRLTPEVAQWILDNTGEPREAINPADPLRHLARIRRACITRLEREKREMHERLAALNPNWGRF
jgi:hypothetical protein